MKLILAVLTAAGLLAGCATQPYPFDKSSTAVKADAAPLDITNTLKCCHLEISAKTTDGVPVQKFRDLLQWDAQTSGVYLYGTNGVLRENINQIESQAIMTISSDDGRFCKTFTFTNGISSDVKIKLLLEKCQP